MKTIPPQFTEKNVNIRLRNKAKKKKSIKENKHYIYPKADS